MFDLYRHFTFLITTSYPKGYSCKYPNCPGFIGRAPVSGILSRCPWLVQFILVFRFFYQKNLYINLIFFTSSEQTYANKCISIIIYSDLYLECYKKITTVLGTTKVILKTFDSNFWERSIRFDYKHQKSYSETFFIKLFVENIIIEGNCRFLNYIRVYLT